MKAKLLSSLFFLLNYFFKIKNFNKKKILIYTDSRGYNVISKFGKTPFDSYIFKLCLSYRVDYFICPEKFTTIIDFIEKIQTIKNINRYDQIILHCGVVDFSPRPISNIEKVKKSKVTSPIFNDLFTNINNIDYHMNPFPIKYYDEYTTTIYSPDYLRKFIIPQVKKIQKLIWIDSNNFALNWEGNFLKGRPKNINETVNHFDEIFSSAVKYRISLKNWQDNEIKKYTIDNIHFSKDGFNIIFDLLKKQIDKQE